MEPDPRPGPFLEPPPVISEGSTRPSFSPAGPWSFWATIGWSVLIAIGYVLTQSFVIGIFIGLGGVPNFDRHNPREAMSNGGVLAFGTLGAAPVLVGLCLGVARLRGGISLKDYFGFRWPPYKVAAQWFGAFILFQIIINLVLSLIDGTASEEFMRNVLATAPGMMPQLWLALVVAAPVSEEIFFRGFLFKGLENSRLGGYGAVLVTAVAFASLHLQYDLKGMLGILGIGLFFGLVRLKTGSVWLCAALHAFLNFLATLGYLFEGR
jgi:uncharacterized protein